MRKLRFFISSPGDVQKERQIAERVIARLSGEFARVVELDPYFWEHEPMQLTANFQAQIASTAEFDLLICILWSRLGTPLRAPDGKLYNSGTEYEVETALQSWRERGRPEVMIYVNGSQPPIKNWPQAELEHAVQQLKALVEFQKKYFLDPETGEFRGAYHSYKDLGRFESLLEDHLRRRIREKFPTPSGEAGENRIVAPTWKKGSPFRGLETFEFEQAEVFFGRTKAIGEVLDQLRRQVHRLEEERAKAATLGASVSEERSEDADSERPAAFVLVSAMSGVGKSSLVRAGVLPLLMRPGVVEGVGLWRRAIFRPSESTGDLFDGLAQALTRAEGLPELFTGETSVVELAAQLRSSPASVDFFISQALGHAADLQRKDEQARLDRLIAESEEEGRSADKERYEEILSNLKPKQARLVLVIDQLEEIFTLERPNQSLEQRQAFVRILARLARGGRVWVLVTLRSDFFSRCAEIPELMDLKRGDGHYDLQPPSKEEIGQIIRQPAAAAGLVYENFEKEGVATSLDEVLRDATVNDPASLPLLEFCLEELYKRCTPGSILTYAAYREIGGVEGALERRAEEVYAGLSPDSQEAFDQVMRRVTTVGVENQAVFNRRWADYEALSQAPYLKSFVDAFLAPDARLFIADRTADGRAIVSVTHEALLRAWPRLQQWLIANHESLLVRAQLATVAQEWRKASEQDKSGFLLPAGLQLEKAKKALEDGYLDAGEAHFVEASVAALAYRQRKEARTRRNVLMAISSALVVATILAVVSFVLFRRSSKAQAHEKVAHQRAEESAKAANDARDQADDLINFMLIDLRNKLETIGRLDVLNDVAQKAKVYLDKLPKDRVTSLNLREQSIVQDNLGDVLVAQGNLAGALEKYRLSERIRKFLTDRDTSNLDWQRDLAVAYNKLGDTLLAQGDLAQALQNYKAALTITKHITEKAPQISSWKRDIAVGYSKVGAALRDQGKLSDALANFEQEKEISQKLLAENSNDPQCKTDLSNAYSQIGQVFTLERQFTDAEDSYSHSLQLRKQLVDADSSDTNRQSGLAVGYSNLGDALSAEGKLEEALKTYRASLEICQKLTARDPSNTSWQRSLAVSYNDMGATLRNQGHLDGALTNFNEGYRITEHLANQDKSNLNWQRDLSFSCNQIADVLLSQGDLEQALVKYHQALTISESLSAKESLNWEWQHDTAVCCERVGDILVKQAKLDEALKFYNRCLGIDQALVGRDQSHAGSQHDVSDAYDRIGDVLMAQGKLADALDRYQKGLAIMKALVDTNPADSLWQRDLSVVYNKMGNLLLTQHKPAEALDQFVQGRGLIEKLAASDTSNLGWRRDLAYSYSQEGRALTLLGRTVEAASDLQRALQIRKEIASNDSSKPASQLDLAFAYGAMGDFYIAQKNWLDALAQYRLCQGLFAQLAAKDAANLSWQRLSTQSSETVADLLVAANQPQEALAVYQETLIKRRALFYQDKSNPVWQKDLGTTLYQLANCFSKLGGDDNLKQAQDCLREALDIVADYHGADRDQVSDLLKKALEATQAKGGPATSPAPSGKQR
jgi:eukaryotic-like serine/threonine-protein kinase